MFRVQHDKEGLRVQASVGGYGLSIHNLDQWDLQVKPWLCIHLNRPNSNTRVLCLSGKAIQVGSKVAVCKPAGTWSVITTPKR